MSQILVTGEAKIRDIQGPVVANSGVITALDGAASQYVRGDGTLADFPTSSGGGSSVSYYLNSSVSQGTIGGVAYRELGKTPITGAGTDITISANGYVANYITDVNDPDVVLVPGGNFNCEFYFSVNNNTGNPTTYAELYKYDGTTFTLLGSNVGVPESINQGTTIAPYYFAIPVATATLALTDRLAIRIYVNVSGRTVTLHTENGHLCQVVTTLSKGMVSLNNLTDQSQFLTTGTSGTNFAIVSSGDTHTFNLPVASATNTGKLSSTDWSTFNNKQPAGNYVTLDTTQTISGLKTFSAASVNLAPASGDGGILNLKRGAYTGGINDYTSLISQGDNFGIASLTSSSNRSILFDFASITSGILRTYTLPNTSGTVALTSNLSAYLPLAGGTLTGPLNGTSVSLSSSLSCTSASVGSTLQVGSTALLYGNVAIKSDSATSYFGLNVIANSNNNLIALNHTGTAGIIETQFSTGGSHTPLQFLTGGTIRLIIASTGAATFTSSVTASSLVKSGGTSSQFLMADGSVNTSVLPSGAYLPLTGGTLTGALSGTSATFSGNVTATGLFGFSLRGRSSDNFGGFGFFSNNGATRYGYIQSGSPNGGQIVLASDGGSDVTLDNRGMNVTGAATFSSSVTANSNSGGTSMVLNGRNNAGVDDNIVSFFKFDGTTLQGRIYARSNILGFRDATNTDVLNIVAGNVGIGTSSPTSLLHLQSATASGTQYLMTSAGGGTALTYRQVANETTQQLNMVVESNHPMVLWTNSVERMRITSDNNVLFNTTSTSPTNSSSFIFRSGSGAYSGVMQINHATTNNTGAGFLDCYYNTNYIGGIQQNGASNVTFSTSSDYRLKEDLKDFSGLNLLSKLKVYDFKWKAEDSRMYGVIAHELQEVIPYVVNGNKDELKENGNIKVQVVDYSKLVPILIKSIQELEAKIVTLESKLN